MKEAVILAAGNSWRLKPNVWTIKPLLEIHPKKTLLDYQVEWLKEHGFDRIIVTSLHDKLTEYDVEYSLDVHPMGTSGSLYNALKTIRSKRIYVMNVDDIVNYNPMRLYTNKSKAIILCTHPKIAFGNIILDDLNFHVIKFDEKPKMGNLIVNVGHYSFDREILDSYLVEKGDLETEVFPKLADDKKLFALFRPNLRWKSVNTLKDLIELRKEMV